MSIKQHTVKKAAFAVLSRCCYKWLLNTALPWKKNSTGNWPCILSKMLQINYIPVLWM